MTFYAYFNTERECIAVNDAVWDASLYEDVSAVEDYRNPNDVYWNGTGAGTRVDADISAWPDYLEVGDSYTINAPFQSSVKVGIASPAYYGSYNVDTSVEADILVQLVGRSRAAKTIHVVDLATRKAQKSAELSTVFDTHLALGVNSALGWVDCDDQAQSRSGARYMQYEFFGLSTSVDTDWIMLDKSVVTHTYAQFVTLCTDITAGFQAYLDNKKALQADIDAAADLAALDAIDLESGWPT